MSDSPIGVYKRAADAANDHINSSLGAGMDPDVMGKFVSALVDIAHPKLRYPVAAGDRLLSKLRRFVPESMFDKSLRKQFHLDDA